MKKITVLLLLLVAACAESVSLQRAAVIAVAEFPDLASKQPQSIPTQPALTDGGSYWIIEFDNVWVPVTTQGTLLKEETDEIKEAYKVHYALQKIIEQRDSNQYPSAKDTSLILLLGDVENKETYLISYKNQLPAELQDECQELIDAVARLKASIQVSLNRINALRARENDVLFSAAGYSDFESWRTDFSSLLSGLSDVASTGYAYDDQRTQFNLAALEFMNKSSDTNAKQLVQVFASGIGISNIPGSLPGLESTVNQWQTWLATLSDEKVSENADSIYTIYREMYTGETITALQKEAYEKVQALAVTVPLVLSELQPCADELTPKKQLSLKDLQETYNKAFNAYNEGRDYEKAFDEKKAKDSYLNAISWAEDAKALEESLADTKCSGISKPTKQPDVIGDFIGSPSGLVFIGLIIALVVLFLWNNRKKEGEQNVQTEYVPDW